MRFRFTIRDLLWLTVVAALTVGWGVTLVENRRLQKPPGVLAQAGPLKIFGNKDFPKDLSREIMIEQNPLPSLSIKGKDETIDSLTIHPDIDSMVSLDRNQVKESYTLVLLGKDRNGDDFLLRDLNLDGDWDVKYVPDGKAKGNYIRLDDKWLEVEEIEGVKSAQPTAKNGKTRFIFDGSWKMTL